MTQPTTRSLTFPCGDLSLEGVLHLPVRQAGVPESTPAAAVVVCHPHPQYGGDMENNVVMVACQALVSQGFAALRFNFRGVGASEGAFDQGEGERNDVRAALSYLASLPDVDDERLGLVGYSFGALVAAEVADSDLRALALVSPPVAHADLRVDWGCPALVLGGNQDQNAPASGGLEAIGGASDVELRVVSGADHFWWGFEEELGEALAGFFERHLA